MRFYKYIAIILVYRNTYDLIECINNMKKEISSLQIIVVNSFYDDSSRREAEEIALQNGCDFLNIENRGYSYGNNQGIALARSKYHYDYIIIANPDTIVRHFETPPPGCEVIAPRIVCASGKEQNPMMVVHNPISEKICYWGFKHRIHFLVLLSIALNKVLRLLFLLFFAKCDSYKIYMPHGSFLLLGKNTVERLSPIYDENMFLFAEESVLATRLAELKIDVIYFRGIEIYHKEDGSMNLAHFSLYEELRKANMYYYETYLKKSKA